MTSNENLRSGERRYVTVLFADMKDFTSLSERMDPEEMDSLMTQVFSAFESIIRRYDGAVEKYIGDALVAVFGVPSMHEDDPARAINSALDFLDEIKRVNDSLSNRGIAVAFRIGINTGLITTGKRGEHDVVTGHAMSVASRLEGAAAINTVLVSDTTRNRCESEFLFSDHQSIQVKGAAQPVMAYQVTDRISAPIADDVELVGRTELISQMFRQYLRHDAGATSGFILTGEAGMGKTRAALELSEKVSRLPDFHGGVLYAKARRYRSRPFALVTDLVLSYFGLTPTAGQDAIAARVQQDLDVEASTADGFARLLVADVDEQNSQAFVLIYLILKSIVKKSADAPYPALVIVDNLEFIDKSSRDFFQFYLKNADAKPFFVLTDRQPEQVALDLFAELTVLPMAPLGRVEMVRLISAAGGENLSAEIIDSILENSRGNPLFVREYTRFAAENRDSQSLPSTIQNIFLTSIDSYTPGFRDLLKKLSVFAHSFTVEEAVHLEEVTDGDPRAVEVALNLFVREGILTQDGDLYLFRYDVFKTALYNSILNYNKRILHRVVADLMVAKDDPHTLRLLHHLCRSEEYDRAREVLSEAQNVTTELDYLPYIDGLLEQDQSHGGRHTDDYMRMMFIKAALLFNNGVSEQADSLLKEIVTRAVNGHSSAHAGSAYHLLLAHNLKGFNFDKALFCGVKALKHYGSSRQGAHSRQNVLALMARVALSHNRPDLVENYLDEIAELKEDPEINFRKFDQLSAVADVHLSRGEYTQALELLHQVVDDVPEESFEWYSIQDQLGVASFLCCDWINLKRHGTTFLAGPSRHMTQLSRTNAFLAVACHSLSEGKECENYLQHAEFHASRIRNDFDRLDALVSLGVCNLLVGRVEQAEEMARSGLSIGLRHTALSPSMTLLMVLAEIARNSSDDDAMTYVMTEAELIVQSDAFLRDRDLLLYHYYRSTVGEESERQNDVTKARALLKKELAAFPEPHLATAFVQTLGFARIHDDLLGAGPDHSSSTA